MIRVKSVQKRGVSVKCKGEAFDTANEAVAAAVAIVESFQQADIVLGELVRETVIQELEKLGPHEEAEDAQ